MTNDDTGCQKLCKKCNTTKSLSQFSRKHDTMDGYETRCKECKKAYYDATRAADIEGCRAKAREYWHSKPKEKRQHIQRVARLKNAYNLSVGEYDDMLAKQGQVCAICRRESRGRRLSVDHCHTTGKIRGLLCHTCNKGLGFVNDNPELLLKLADYLKAH